MFEKLKECHCACKHFIKILAGVLLLLLCVFFSYEIRNIARQYGYIGRAPLTQYTITVSGEGKVTAVPDIAVINLGVQSDAKTVAAAQSDNSKKMNAIVKAVKDMGVKSEDIQTTNYNIYPKYSYDRNSGLGNIVGYTVSQSVTVKVRDLDKTGDILSKAGELGANQVGGISFSIDNPDKLKSDARQKAVDNAKAKAADLFRNLGITVGRIVSFDEYTGGSPIYAKEMSYGIGGGPPVAAPAPSIETGSQDIVVDVNLTFEIK